MLYNIANEELLILSVYCITNFYENLDTAKSVVNVWVLPSPEILIVASFIGFPLVPRTKPAMLGSFLNSFSLLMVQDEPPPVKVYCCELGMFTAAVSATAIAFLVVAPVAVGAGV